MDTVENYRQIIRRLIEEYASYKPAVGDIHSEVFIDPATDHYQLMRIGWLGSRRIHGVVFHIDIIDGKVWVQHDGTSVGIADELVAAGIPREAIVLGYKPADIRKYTGFAVA